MTAIAGFHCEDGVVLAGDTEETYAADKAYAHKLFPVEREHSRLCVAGAGLGYLVDFANEQIVRALDSGITTVGEFEKRLAAIMDHLYRDKFTRFPVNDAADLRIDLIVGVQFTKQTGPTFEWLPPALFECRSNLVTPIGRTKHSCIIGTGELIKHLGTEFSGWGLDTKLAEWASLYVIHQAKRRFGGVGGKTHIFTMRNDGTHHYDLGVNSHDKEAVLEAFGRIMQLLMLALSPSVSRSQDVLDAVRKWMANVRRYLQALESGKPKYASINIRSREIDRMLRQISRATRLASQKSKPEP